MMHRERTVPDDQKHEEYTEAVRALIESSGT
jgi:hypothetical protein